MIVCYIRYDHTYLQRYNKYIEYIIIYIYLWLDILIHESIHQI